MISYKRIFHFFVFLLFFSFMVLYYSYEKGYYKDENYKKKIITEEKIKQFEKDVESGKKIKVENYISNYKKDYSNRFSDFGLKSSNIISKYFKKIIIKIFGSLSNITDE